jgi:hypothetical protein
MLAQRRSHGVAVRALAALLLVLAAQSAMAGPPAGATPETRDTPILRQWLRGGLQSLGVGDLTSQRGETLEQCYGECCCVSAGYRRCADRDSCTASGGRCVPAPDGC